MFNPPPPSKIQGGGLRPPQPPLLFGAPELDETTTLMQVEIDCIKLIVCTCMAVNYGI